MADRSIFGDQEMGMGTWAWGDRLYWGYGKDYDDEALHGAFKTGLDNGVVFFDTAEVYGQGKAETLLGQFIQLTGARIKVATKFMPFPWRLTRGSLLNALRASLKRMGLAQIELYQLQMPLPPISIEKWMDSLAESVKEGLAVGVGVSNLSLEQLKRAVEALGKRGISLAAAQVEFSLLDRKNEENGVIRFCKEQNITVIAYSPLGMGMLSGKYSEENFPHGLRGQRFTSQVLREMTPLIDLLRRVGLKHGGKTPAQAALNWVIRKGAFPIPGAKNSDQARDNCGAAGWSLTEDEIAELDQSSIQTVTSL